MTKGKISFLRDLAETTAALTLFGILLWLFLTMASDAGRADEPEEGVGRATAYLSGASLPEGYSTAEKENAVLRAYTEGEGTPPEWWKPEEPMAVEWQADFEDLFVDVNEMVDGQVDDQVERVDGGCPDWNADSTLYGWDGHRCEAWEMTLFSKIVYLEVWGCSRPCCEAVTDSILNLWDSGYFGETLGELLTATAEDGNLVYSPYVYVWDWDYDPDGLAEMRELCEERFSSGPQYDVSFFRLWYYHPWAEDAFAIDNVYFSRGRQT